jgi:hypothetical protein
MLYKSSLSVKGNRVTLKNVWLFDYHFSSVVRYSFSTC